MELDLLVEAFNKCFEMWLVNSFLSIGRTTILQNIRLIAGDIQKQREVGEIVLNEEIIVYFKNRERGFEEMHGVSKIQFHGDWEGVENVGYQNTNDSFYAGWRGVMGVEWAMVKLIAGDGSVIDSFTVISKDKNINAVVGAIRRDMKLSTKIPRRLVDLDLLRCILECLRKYAASWSLSSKKDVSLLISKLEALVSDGRE